MTYKDARLLIVDDNENNRYTLKRRLVREGYKNIAEVNDGRQAVDYVENHEVDLMFLDLMMPEMDGFQVLEHLKETSRLIKMPVIMISADEAIENVVRGIELGATDYLAKPFNPALLRARLNATLEKKYLQDIEASYLERFDQETNLPNRRHFLSLAGKQMAGLAGEEDGCCILCVSVRTLYHAGSGFSDQDIQALNAMLADKISEKVGPDFLVGKTGQDSFSLFIHADASDFEVQQLAQEISETLYQHIRVGSEEVVPGANIGIANSTSGGDVGLILNSAEVAMAKARDVGDRSIVYFDQEMQRSSENRRAIQVGLNNAIQNNELSLFYQPLVCAKTKKIVGAEALIRWFRADGKMVPPLDFIPVAEETGQMMDVGAWVIHEGVRQAAEWRNRFGAERPFTLNVNVSPKQFFDQDIVGEFQAAFERHGKVAMKAEVTETAMMNDVEAAEGVLAKLRSGGVLAAMDDFGTGYSSLGSLRAFSFDTLKVDKSFVDHIETDQTSRAIIRSVFLMAHAMGINVVAEGVENEQQYEMLKEWGCDLIQGYYFSKPLPADEFAELYEAHS